MNDDDVFLDLAFDGAEDVDDVTLARARRLVRADGGLARAYAVLDDAIAVCVAHGVDPARVARSPLAQLLEAEASSPASSSSPWARLSSSLLPLSAAAAALALFIVAGDDDGARSPGTKGVSYPGVPAVVVNVREAKGPLGEGGVVAGLEPRAADLGRCSAGDVVVDVRFRVRGDGLVEGAAAFAEDDAAAGCVKAVVERAAFALYDDATDVDAAIELHPAGGSP